ncbi:MAG TPA: retropepsin-like aspartic protease, partial [Puia sp.]|nr:retropepsin-like aspartic protease [Puia sp.]
SPQKKLYFLSFVDNVFNKNEASIKDVNILLDEYRSQLSDSSKASLLLLQQDNYFKTFQYARAFAMDKQLIKQYGNALDSSSIDDINNKLLIDSGLASVPAQQVSIPGSTSIPWQRDKIGLLEIPVRMHDTTVASIFDTRANISSISASFAKRLGVRLMNVDYTEGSGATGNTFKVGLGIADSLWMGSILVRHVVFQVMPDEVLYIAPIDFRMNMIIGYPVIAQLREVNIKKSGSIFIPAQPTANNLRNLGMDGLDPIVSCIVNTDTLTFQFDTGASTTDFYENYFLRFEKNVRQKGLEDSVKSGGAGGVIQQKIYWLKDVSMTIGNKTTILKKVSVQEEPLGHINQKFYGNIGQDLMAPFDETILNFESMYIEFR